MNDKLKPQTSEQQEVASIYEELLDTYLKKNADYGDSFTLGMNRFGEISALTRIYDKFNRVATLIDKKTANNNEQYVIDESIEDTLLDMANYCVMTVAYTRAKKIKEQMDKIPELFDGEV